MMFFNYSVISPEKIGTHSMFDLLMEIGRKLDELAESHNQTAQTLRDRIREEEEVIAELRGAYPGDDPVGHRNYHEEVIQNVKSRKGFYQKLTFELSKWGLIGFCGWLIIQVWHGALKGPQ